MNRSVILAVLSTLTGCDEVFGLEGRGEGADAALANGLIVHYTMDALDGVLTDSTGNAHTGVCSPLECPQPTPGVLDGALRFDGTASQVVVPSAADLERGPAFTVALWIKLEQRPMVMELACPIHKAFDATFYNSFQLCINDGRYPIFETTDSQMRPDFLAASTPLDMDKWRHVTMTWNGEKTLYIDGIDGSVAAETTREVIFGQGELRIGADANGAAAFRWFGGSIDDVRIYDRVLTPFEILELVAMR